MITKIIIGEKSFDVIKSTWEYIKKGRWQNYTAVKIRVKVEQEVKRFLYEHRESNPNRDSRYLTFHVIRNNGIFLFETDLKGIQGLSKFRDGSEICQLSLIVWNETPLSKDEQIQMQRDLVLKNIGI